MSTLAAAPGVRELGDQLSRVDDVQIRATPIVAEQFVQGERPGRGSGMVSVDACSSAHCPCSRQVYDVWRDTPASQLRWVTSPYAPLPASIRLTHCARWPGVLACRRTIGPSPVRLVMWRISPTHQGCSRSSHRFTLSTQTYPI